MKLVISRKWFDIGIHDLGRGVSGCVSHPWRQHNMERKQHYLSHEYREKTFRSHVRVRIDPVSATYLQGATLDFEVERFNSQFVMRNPKATTTCGCGKSFKA